MASQVDQAKLDHPVTYSFSDGDLKDIWRSYRLGGLNEGEVNRLLQRSPEVIGAIERYSGDVNDYISDICAGDGDESYDILEHLPVIATYFDSEFETFDVGFHMVCSGDDKKTEYFLRSKPTWEGEMEPGAREEVIRAIGDELYFGHRPVLSQYLPVIQDLAPVETDLLEQEIYSKITGDSCMARAAASTPFSDLPGDIAEYVPDRVRENAISIDGVVPRTRGIKGAKGCEKLEPRHLDTFLGEDPTKETVLLSLDDNLVGALKETNANSILGLRDVENNGRYPIWKGWTYRSTWNLWNRREEAEEIQGWQVMELDHLPIDPMGRQTGEEVREDPEWFRELIDSRVEELEEELLEQ